MTLSPPPPKDADMILAGNVWEDVDHNGVLDNGEFPMEGVRVFLDQNQNNIFDDKEIFTLSGPDGQYSFLLESGRACIFLVHPK